MKRTGIAFALAALTAAPLALPAPPARAQQAVGAIGGGGGLDYQQARRRFPGLTEVMFDKADLNGDGVIEPNELPVLQGIYQQITQN